MPRYVAFLRAINVGGHVVKMDELKRHFVAAGFKDAETFIASGNVVFSTKSADAASHAAKIESRLLKALGYEVHTFLRTDAEVVAAGLVRPWPEPRIASARAFSIGFFAEPLTAAQRKAVKTFTTKDDEFHVNGRDVYWLCRTGQGQSVFNLQKFERALGARGSFRGMNTITRLVAKYGFGATT
jgi:uncharacterized protein (DUF1697 family)